MTFRNIIFSAIVVGVIIGSLYGLFQQYLINPIIYAAESFEVRDVIVSTNTGAQDDSEVYNSHSQSNDYGWSPANNLQRITATLVTNIMTAITFSLILISVMSFHNLKSNKPKLNWKTGILWGLALMLSMFVAPSLLGLYSEIPGTISEPIGQRQILWISSAGSTALGLMFIYYSSPILKIVGTVLLILPQVLGAPTHQTHRYANTDPIVVETLNQLSNQFITMTTIGMAIFCLLMGALCGFSSTRFIRFEHP